MATTQDGTIAELQRANAELRRERDAASAQKDALAEVLGVISRSPSDTQRVFDLIVQQAAKLCEVPVAAVAMFDGTMIHLAAQNGLDAAYADIYVAQYPRPVGLDSTTGRAILNRRVEQVEDIAADPGHRIPLPPGSWSRLAVPLLREGMPLGALVVARPVTGAFSNHQIMLLKTFADQAVIAITGAENFRALQTRTGDLQESLEYQTATSDVLKVISRSTFDLQPVLDTLVETAARLCNADQAVIARPEGDLWRLRANFGFPPEFEADQRERGLYSLDPHAPTVSARAVRERRPVHIHDVAEVPGYPEIFIRVAKQRTSLGVPLLREGEAIGYIVLARQRVEPFTDRQIELVSTFADQAVIAIENSRLITEQREALEQQTATAEVLQVINASPGTLAPVFDVILEKAHQLCGSIIGNLVLFDGTEFRRVAYRGMSGNVSMMLTDKLRQTDERRRLVQGERFIHVANLDAPDAPQSEVLEALRDREGVRSYLLVPMRKDGVLLGYISANWTEPRPGIGKEVALLENFAAQAVIAMENARLLDEIRQRQEELRVTFENMGDGVAMFDETPRLVAWNRKFQDILDLPNGVLAERLTFAEYIHYLAARGEFGVGADPEEQVRCLIDQAGQARTNERTRPDGRVIEIRHNPVASGGFVLIYADITERKRNEAEIRAARDAAEEASHTIEAAYRELKAAQANLIQAEKMASLGQLTAGIAHEIKNPLNFVNNFAELSVDLLRELKDAITPAEAVDREASKQRLLSMAADYDARARAADELTKVEDRQ